MDCPVHGHADYSLVEPFEIDNEELSGLSPKQCFVLGVEWRQFYEKVRKREPFSMGMHESNYARLARMARRHGALILGGCIAASWYSISVRWDEEVKSEPT